MTNVDEFYPNKDPDYKDIVDRIPSGWGKWIDCGPGWKKLIVELNESLRRLDPEYEVHQVKEKFGGLRYYAACHGNTFEGKYSDSPFYKLIAEAEQKSYTICEECGEPGVLREGGWWQTLCDRHAKGREPLKDDD